MRPPPGVATPSMGRGAGAIVPAWMQGSTGAGAAGTTQSNTSIDQQGFFVGVSGRRLGLPDRFGRDLSTPVESQFLGGTRPCNANCNACGAFGHRAWECAIPRQLLAQGKISVIGGPM